MPCFCSIDAHVVASFQAKADLTVQAVPPQLAQLSALLSLEASARADASMAAALPDISGDAWLSATIGATTPLPVGPGPLLSLMARVSMVAGTYPVTHPQRLRTELLKARATLTAQLAPMANEVRKVSWSSIQNIVLAARLTLSLREQGICPMALAQVDGRFSAELGLEAPRTRVQSTVRMAAHLEAHPPQSFALTAAQVSLAAKMSAFAGLGSDNDTMGLPDLQSSSFVDVSVRLIADLSSVVAPNISVSAMLDAAAKIEALATVKAAFGEDALTAQGVARIEAMLSFMARLQLPTPTAALSLQAQLDVLPPMEDVRAGASNAQTASAVFAASMTIAPPVPDVLPMLEGLVALEAVLETTLGQPTCGRNAGCQNQFQR